MTNTQITEQDAVRLPIDGTPLCPSKRFAEIRDQGPSARMLYQDGHIGHLAVDYELAKAVLESLGFSLSPTRLPEADHGIKADGADDLDEAAKRGLKTTDLLTLDGDRHARIRRTILPKLSVKTVNSIKPQIAQIVAKQLEVLSKLEGPVDITHQFSEPISFAGHGLLLGIDENLIPEFAEVYSAKSTAAERFAVVRKILEAKRSNLGEDVLSTLINSDLTTDEQEGLTFVLLNSGRDSVAYFLTTSILALLKNPAQLEWLMQNKESTPKAVEELIRYGTMFITLFPRTATEDVELCGVSIKKGETVSASAVAANRDEKRFPHPHELDLTREATGHIGFGHGSHSCLGQQYARAVLIEGIWEFFQAFPNTKLVSAHQDTPQEFAHPIATYEGGALIANLK
jgi:cytochrome P450